MKEKLYVWILVVILWIWNASATKNSVVFYNRPMGNDYGYSTYVENLGFSQVALGYPSKESNPTSLVVNDTKIFVLGTFDLWNQDLIGGIVQYDIPARSWSTVGMGMIGRVDSLLVDKHSLVFFGAITGYQENPTISTKGVVLCDFSGKNCEQYGNGISDYMDFGAMELVDSITYTSYQSTNRTWTVRRFQPDSKNWISILAAYNSFLQIATINNILHVVGNFSYGSSNGSIANYNPASSSWNILSSERIFDSSSRPSVVTHADEIWAFMPPRELVRWNSPLWQTISMPFSCDESTRLYGGEYLTMICNGTAYALLNVTERQSTWNKLDFGINSVTQLASVSTGLVFAAGSVLPSGVFMLDKLANSTDSDYGSSYVLNISQTETTFRGQCAIGSKILTSGEFKSVYTTPITNYTALWDGTTWKNFPVYSKKVLCCTNNGTLFVGYEKGETNQMSFGIFNYDKEVVDMYHVNISYGNGSISVIRATNNYLYFAYGHSTFASVMRWKLKGSEPSDLTYLFNITAGPQPVIAVNDIQTDDSVLFIGGTFAIHYTWNGMPKTSLNLAKFNLHTLSFEYVDHVGTNQSTVLSISLTPDTVFVGGAFITAGSLRVNNIAGCSWNGTFVDNLNSGVPSSTYVKDLLYDATADRLFFLAAQKFSCGPACSTLYDYRVTEKYLDYNIKEGLASMFVAVAPHSDDNSNDDSLMLILIIVIPSAFVILALGVFIYLRKCRGRKGYLEISDGPLFGFSSSDYDGIDFAVEPFEMKTILGRGSFGSVWSCVLPNRNGATYAVKQMLLSVGDKERINVIENEIATLQKLKHRNIVHFVGYKKVQGTSTVEFFIFMELFEKPSSLKGVITKMAKKGETFPPKKVKDMLQQIAEGLKYLHNNGIAHRDLKSANVLVRVSGGEVRSLHIADFGLATTAVIASTLTGTPAFMAPEMSEKKYDPFKADIWAFGMVMYEILTLMEPAVAGVRPSLPDSISNDPRYDSLVTLFNLCTSIDVDDRPDAAELLSLCHRL